MPLPATEEIYERIIKPLPPDERLRLATMILSGIPPQVVSNYREEWSEEDLRDARFWSIYRAAHSFGEAEDG